MMTERTNCIIILGMHRSGTSLVAGIVKTLGVYMGSRFRVPDEHNRSGYFEDLDWRDLNRKILGLAGGTWYRPPSRGSIVSLNDRMGEEIQSLVINRESLFVPWGWKDPRSCLTIELIHRYLQSPFYIVVNRNENDVISSLEKRAMMRGYHEDRSHWVSLVREYNKRRNEFVLEHKVPFCTVSYEGIIGKTYENVLAIADVAGIKDKGIINRACEVVVGQ